MRFTPPGAIVRVECGSDDEWISIKVIDAGPGIAPHEMDQIFDRFYRGRQISPAHGGGGLGLAIAKRIVELHDGTIAAVNGPAEGAVFDVRLPPSRSAARAQQHV